MKYKNHLSIDSYQTIHRNKEISTNINSDDFEKFTSNLKSLNFTVGVVQPGYEHRADKISYLFYSTPELDWLICWYNNISDPLQQLNVGDQIKIPSLV